MSESQLQPYQDDFTAVYLTTITGVVTIPQGDVDLQELEVRADDIKPCLMSRALEFRWPTAT